MLIGYILLLTTIRYSLRYARASLPGAAYDTATGKNLEKLLNAIGGTSVEKIPGHEYTRHIDGSGNQGLH